MNRGDARELAERREAMLERISAILVEDLAIKAPPGRLDPDVPLFGVGFGLDSVDGIELAFTIEKVFAIELPQDDRFPLITRTLNCIVDYLLTADAEGSPALGAPSHRHALRSSVARVDSTHVTLARLSSTRGNPEDTLDALDRLLAGALFLYDGQAKPTLMLREDGTIEADVTIANVGGDYILFVDGLSFEELLRRLDGAPHIGLRDLRADHVTVGLHGPFAWELLGEWMGRRVVNLPPLGVLSIEQCLVVRGGRTGEYGYEVLLPRDLSATSLAKLEELGLTFDLAPLSLEALDAATVEAGGFSIRSLGGRRLTPSELQLGWRIPQRSREAPSEPSQRRVTYFVGDGSTTTDGSLQLEGSSVGEILASYIRPETAHPLMGIALVDSAFAHPGLQLITESGCTVHTRSAPLVVATSVGIRTQVDSYRSHRPSPQ